MNKTQYHSTAWENVPSIERYGLRFPRSPKEVATMLHSVPTISTTDDPEDAMLYNPRGALIEVRVRSTSKYLKKSNRNIRRGESFLDAANRWAQECLDKGKHGYFAGGMQSTLGNQTVDPSALEFVRVVNRRDVYSSALSLEHPRLGMLTTIYRYDSNPVYKGPGSFWAESIPVARKYAAKKDDFVQLRVNSSQRTLHLKFAEDIDEVLYQLGMKDAYGISEDGNAIYSDPGVQRILRKKYDWVRQRIDDTNHFEWIRIA